MGVVMHGIIMIIPRPNVPVPLVLVLVVLVVIFIVVIVAVLVLTVTGYARPGLCASAREVGPCRWSET